MKKKKKKKKKKKTKRVNIAWHKESEKSKIKPVPELVGSVVGGLIDTAQ